MKRTCSFSLVMLALLGCDRAASPTAPTTSAVPASAPAVEPPARAAEPAAPGGDAADAAPGPVNDSPAPAAAAAPVGPARLTVAVEGHSFADVALVGERAMVHTRQELVELGRDGAVVQRFANLSWSTFAVGPDGKPFWTRTEGEPTWFELLHVGGWGDGRIFGIFDLGGRGGSVPMLAYYDDGAWKQQHAINGEIAEAWGWLDGSILARMAGGRYEGKFPRLAVVRGVPKAPKLDGLRAASHCAEADAVVDVDASGAIALGLMCAAGNWVWSWRPGDTDGESHRLPGGPGWLGLDLAGPRIAVIVKDERRLHVRDEGGWQQVDSPGRAPPTRVVHAPDGSLWLATEKALYRRTNGEWQDMVVPGDAAIKHLAGVDIGRAWVVRGETQAFARRGEAWDAVEIPTGPFSARRVKEIFDLHVSPAGQAWIQGYFFVQRPGRVGAQRHHAILTSGAVAQPLRIGQAIGPIPWPRPPDPACGSRLVLLIPPDHERSAGDYKGLRKLLRGHTELGTPRFVELALSGVRWFAAIVPDDATAQALLKVAAKQLRWIEPEPEVTCGDADELARTNVTITRELAIDLATGEVKPPAVP